jgi:hypothetical protein
MNNDAFFNGGWCWMTHPSRNIGNPIPVFMYEVAGTRYYVPLDPSEGGELCWDERDEEWTVVASEYPPAEARSRPNGWTTFGAG